MQGLQIITYVGAEWNSSYRRPTNVKKIIKSWAPSQKQAEEKKKEMERKHGGITVIRR